VTALRAQRRIWLTVEEWCEVTGAKPNTVRRQLREGRLSGRKTKSGWRVLASELTKHGGR
jgi:excisionase family DNA binding protein